jgi:tetratricopeptide (TPR) repeat protein
VHEVIVPVNGFYERQGQTGLQIHHHADDSKPRSSYLPLLELAVIEDPEDDRNTYYLARELFFNGRTRDAAAQFKRHLSLPRAVWRPERAASMRYLAKLEPYEAEHWLLRACAEAPGYREPWLDLAELYAMNDMWGEARGAALRGLQITNRQQEYLTEARAWSGRLEELLDQCERCMKEIEAGLNHSAPPVVHPA